MRKLIALAVGLMAPHANPYLFPIQLTPTTITVINPNNPASAASIRDRAGNVWSFNTSAGMQDGEGDWLVLRNGAAQDPGGGAWQIKVDSNGTAYAYNMAQNNWSRWSGSPWSSYGSAPPVSSTSAIPMLLGLFPGSTNDSGTLRALGRLADDSAAVTPSGPFNEYGDLMTANTPTDITYDANICTGVASQNNPNPGYCQTAPPGATAYGTDWCGVENGTYDTAIVNQIQTYLLPFAQDIYYVRVGHEAMGNWYPWSPWYGGSETNSITGCQIT